MKDRKKVIYIGVTDKHFTHLNEYRILSSYSDGSILVLNDYKCKSVVHKGYYVLKN